MSSSLSLHFPVTRFLFLTLEHTCQYISDIPIATRPTFIQYSQAGCKNIAQILRLHLNLAFKLSQLLFALLQALSIDSIFIKRTQSVWMPDWRQSAVIPCHGYSFVLLVVILLEIIKAQKERFDLYPAPLLHYITNKEQKDSRDFKLNCSSQAITQVICRAAVHCNSNRQIKYLLTESLVYPNWGHNASDS